LGTLLTIRLFSMRGRASYLGPNVVAGWEIEGPVGEVGVEEVLLVQGAADAAREPRVVGRLASDDDALVGDRVAAVDLRKVAVEVLRVEPRACGRGHAEGLENREVKRSFLFE